MLKNILIIALAFVLGVLAGFGGARTHPGKMRLEQKALEKVCTDTVHTDACYSCNCRPGDNGGAVHCDICCDKNSK